MPSVLIFYVSSRMGVGRPPISTRFYLVPKRKKILECEVRWLRWTNCTSFFDPFVVDLVVRKFTYKSMERDLWHGVYILSWYRGRGKLTRRYKLLGIWVHICHTDGFKQFRDWYGASVGERQSGVGWTPAGNRLPRLVTFGGFPHFHKANSGTFVWVWNLVPHIEGGT